MTKMLKLYYLRKHCTVMLMLAATLISGCGAAGLQGPCPVPQVSNGITMPLEANSGIELTTMVWQSRSPLRTPIGKSQLIIDTNLDIVQYDETGSIKRSDPLKLTGNDKLTVTINGEVFDDIPSGYEFFCSLEHELNAQVPASNEGYNITTTLHLQNSKLVSEFTLPSLIVALESSGDEGYHYQIDTLDVTWDENVSPNLWYEAYVSEDLALPQDKPISEEAINCDFGTGFAFGDDPLPPFTLSPDSGFGSCTRNNIAPEWTLFRFQNRDPNYENFGIDKGSFSNAHVSFQHSEYLVVKPAYSP